MNKKNELTRQNSTSILVKGFRELGIKKSDAVLVHSSLSSFGHVEGGAETVIDALLEAVGEEGTVLVPTLTGSEKLSAKNPPRFDVRTSACWTGTIPETFRKRAAAVRSLHPTHSVAAIGAKAKFFTEGHENCYTPCGENSPYHKLAKSGGYVLLAGVNLSCCTLFHTVEELAGVDYVCQDEKVNAVVVDYEGAEHTLKIKIHKYGDERDFPKMEPMFMEKGILKKGMVGKAQCRLVAAGRLLKESLEMVTREPGLLLKA